MNSLVEEFRDIINNKNVLDEAVDNEMRRKIIFNIPINISGIGLEKAGMPKICGYTHTERLRDRIDDEEIEYESFVAIIGIIASNDSYGPVIYQKTFSEEEEAIAHLKEKQKEIKLG